jgi:hypothetical protein
VDSNAGGFRKTIHHIFMAISARHKQNNLLTVDEVKNRLKVNRATVYKYKNELGGFYLFGSRCLRFTKEAIDGYLEGQKTGGVGLDVPIQTKDIRRPVYNERPSKNRQGSKTQGYQIADTRDPERHGL